MSMNKHVVKISLIAVVLITASVYWLIWNNSQFGSNNINALYILGAQKNMNTGNVDLTSTRIAAVTTVGDYMECKQILDVYSNKAIQWPELESKFANNSFTLIQSQSMQDWFLFSSMFRWMYDSGKRGIYVDLAANHPKRFSNTWFLDKCLSWNGLCIEAEPNLIESLRVTRSCRVVDTCVWSEQKNLTFASLGGAAFAGLKDHNRIASFHKESEIKEISMECTTISKILSDFGLIHIDYLSLDIEGAEPNALMGIDFNRVSIDVFTVEINNDKYNDDVSVFDILTKNGYLPKFRLPHRDVVFVHKNATDKMTAIDNWIATVPWQNRVVKENSVVF